jgi:hypothetical protein
MPTLPPPSTCIITGYLKDPSGQPVVGATVTFQINDQSANDLSALQAAGAMITATAISATTDANGYFTLTLIQSSALSTLLGHTSVHYRVTITSLGIDGYVIVPTLSTVDLSTLKISPAIPHVVVGLPSAAFSPY